MHGPAPETAYPMPGIRQVVFLKNFITRPNIEIGDFTYYDDLDAPERFELDNVLYHYEFIGDRLVIGRFCALATGVRFVMGGANHALDGFSTYPFNIFGAGWEAGFDPASLAAGQRGDTVVGNDVWIGREAMILPGVTIGDGVIVAARAVVSRDVEPYAIVAGNPARVVRERFDASTVARLREIAWWDWPADKITRNLAAIRGADLAALEAAV